VLCRYTGMILNFGKIKSHFKIFVSKFACY
jgi:hypothetical protein